MKKAEVMKKELIELGIEIAKEEGVGSITIRSFAKRAGLAVGSIYYYFDKKEDLIDEIIRAYWERAIDNDLVEVIEGADDFIGGLDRVYLTLYEKSFEFHRLLIGDYIRKNRTSMEIYLGQVKLKIKSLIYRDRDLVLRIEELTSMEDFLDYIIDNIFASLKRSKKDLGFMRESLIASLKLEGGEICKE